MMFSQSATAGECLERSTANDAVEAELVRAACAGSPQAAGEIVRMHHRHVFNFLWQMMRHRQDAEDVTQETFIKAFRSLHRFDTARPLINWLLTIARRSALNHFRGARDWSEVPENVSNGEPSPASLAEEREEVDDIWDRARRVLGQREFEVLWLRFGENLSTEETARVAGLTKTHVKVLVFRARRRLLERRTLS
jgi:RNA polymerase sigma-70 factor (ECF subfamily)